MEYPNKIPAQSNLSSDKLLTIMEVLAGQDEPARLQDLARLARMNPSTTLRFLAALQSRDYVVRDMDTGRYYMTYKLCGLADSIRSRFDVRNISLPFLRSLSRTFLESANLSVESDLSVLYVEVVQGPRNTLVAMQRIGNVAPLHCTGVGKLLLTNRNLGELRELAAAKGLPALTGNTITGVKELFRELERIRAQGYALDNEECETGIRCVAAPLRDYTGKVVAGISVSGPAARMTSKHIQSNLPALLEAAAEISLRLGWQGTASGKER